MPARYSISVLASAGAIPPSLWRRVAAAGDPFLNAYFLTVLERHGAAARASGWQAHHLLANDERGCAVGLLPLYLKTHSHGEFIYDWSWAAAYRQWGLRYYPKLISCLPHTPVSGPRFLVADLAEAEDVRQALFAAAIDLAGECAASSWHVALADACEAERLQSAGLLLSHDLQFHWTDSGYGDFEGYLARFSSARRRKVRAERRQVRESGLAIETLHGDEIAAAEWPVLHALYAETFARFNNFAAWSAACLSELAVALGRRMVVFIARERRLPVAMALCFRSDEALYGRYWGCRDHYRSLHFELCFYQGITYCLQNGLRRFEPGAGGEHKLARGFVPTIVRSAHWLREPAMRALIGRHLQQQRVAIEAYKTQALAHLPFRHALPAAAGA